MSEAEIRQKLFDAANGICQWRTHADGEYAIKAMDLAREFIEEQAKQIGSLEAEVTRLNQIINTPETDEFIAAISREAEHQRQRWPADHDAEKTAWDWFWLIGYLAQKAASADTADKFKHHIITTAAACLNWHKNISQKAYCSENIPETISEPTEPQASESARG